MRKRAYSIAVKNKYLRIRSKNWKKRFDNRFSFSAAIEQKTFDPFHQGEEKFYVPNFRKTTFGEKRPTSLRCACRIDGAACRKLTIIR